MWHLAFLSYIWFIVIIQSLLHCALIDIYCFVLGPQLKVIASMSVGYEHIDLEEAKKRNICVCNTPNVSTDSVAETTVALLLFTARRMKEGKHCCLIFIFFFFYFSPNINLKCTIWHVLYQTRGHGRILLLRKMRKNEKYNFDQYEIVPLTVP